MRKLFTFLAASAMAVAVNAQGYEGNKFFDNWYVGIEAGGTTATTGNPVGSVANTNKAWTKAAFWSGMRPVFGVEIGKDIIPAAGFAVQAHTGVNWTDSKTALDYIDLAGLGKLSLINLFAGYTGKPRVFDLQAVAGAGVRVYLSKDCNYVSSLYQTAYIPGASLDNTRISVIAKAGLNFLFNLGEKKAWTVAIKPAIVWDMDGFARHYENGAELNINSSNIELMAGLTYHFLTSNGKHHFTKVRPYDEAEIDALNGRINALRGELDNKNRRIGDLESELNDLRNRPAEVVERIVEKPVTVAGKNTNTLETSVFFKLAKSVIDASQVPNVERVAIYLKNHKDAKVVIRGYASKDGNEELNIKLANNRAAAVKNMLIQKYGISADRIDAQGNGISEMFEEPEWNRVSICTLSADK